MVPPSILIPHTPRREGPRSERSLLTAFPLSPTYQRLTSSARDCRRFSAGSAGDLQGWRNVYGRANETCAESVGTWGSISGDWGFPSEEIKCLHQVHPVNNKRLLRMKSRFWETPDGAAIRKNRLYHRLTRSKRPVYAASTSLLTAFLMTPIYPRLIRYTRGCYRFCRWNGRRAFSGRSTGVCARAGLPCPRHSCG